MKNIIHLDIDYFFAQVEELLDPRLAKHPIAIGSYGLRSVLCTSNYIARKYGVKSAMPSVTARKRCPSLIIINPKMELYREYSEKVFGVFERYSDKIEIVSVDEAYLDVSGSNLFEGSATLIAKDIRKAVRAETGLTCSAGVSYNKFLSKIGSDFNKPDGMKVFEPITSLKEIQSLSLSEIPGVGKGLKDKLASKGYFRFYDLLHLPRYQLGLEYGKIGDRLYDFIRGIDTREVVLDSQRKSLGAEVTLAADESEIRNIEFYLDEVYKRFLKRLDKCGDDKIKKISVKIKSPDFKNYTLEMLSNDTSKDNFKKLLRSLIDEKRCRVRLIGIGVRFEVKSKEEESYQLSFKFIEQHLQVA
jgi:DNA polymerase-4